jgi:hypothetical protein
MTPSQIKRADITRSKALAYGLSGHLGCWGASHRFSMAYDLATGSETAIDKRWLRCFQGQVALSSKAVEKLATAFPTYAVQRMYLDGPCGLWQALWGELGELGRGVLADDLAKFGDFSQALYEFEADILLMDAYSLLEPELSVGHLAKAVAYFRLQSSLFDLDSGGMVLVIRRCMGSRLVQAELGVYGVLCDIRDALEAMEHCSDAPSSDQRWDAVVRHGRLAWVGRDEGRLEKFSR